MNEIFTAIYNKFTTDPLDNFYVSIGGRLYLEKAPQNAVYPYVVYSMITDERDWMFEEEFEEFTIDFNIWSQAASADEAGDILGYLKALFDDCSLTVAGGWRHLLFQRDVVFGNHDLEEDPPIWGYLVQYTVMVED